MKTDPEAIARRITAETGLPFEARIRSDGSIELTPAGHASAHTFSLIISTGWRSIEIRFEQGAFSGNLVSAMGSADEDGRALFVAVLQDCVAAAATVSVRVNGGLETSGSAPPWHVPWKTLALTIRKGQLPLGDNDTSQDALVLRWTACAAAAVVALLPLDDLSEPTNPDVIGFPEGAKTRIEVNRYERDRRNRAAALAIHGCACLACGNLLAVVYGEAAANFIEVHHVKPVSELGPDYRINPRTDLVPLCPNCHGVAHRRVPPYSVSELRELIAQACRSGR
jgi:5-methylcytosine-specific restriction enzyme A